MGMLYCTSIKKLWEDVHAKGTYVRDLHKTILFTCKACMSFVTYLLNIKVPYHVNLMYKRLPYLITKLKAIHVVYMLGLACLCMQLCMNLIAVARAEY